MIYEASEPRPVPIRDVVAWTLGPLAFSIVMMFATKLPMPGRLGAWMIVLVFLATVIGQCIAIKKSIAASSKGRSIAIRIFAILCTLTSCLLLFVWIGVLAISGFYATHPNAPMLFGGR